MEMDVSPAPSRSSPGTWHHLGKRGCPSDGAGRMEGLLPSQPHALLCRAERGRPSDAAKEDGELMLAEQEKDRKRGGKRYLFGTYYVPAPSPAFPKSSDQISMVYEGGCYNLHYTEKEATVSSAPVDTPPTCSCAAVRTQANLLPRPLLLPRCWAASPGAEGPLSVLLLA